MKRIAILLIVALVASVSMFADESPVIDFSKLVADYPSASPTDNQATLVDFSVAAGSSFTAAEKAKMVTSLAIENWEVKLNSSANSVTNAGNSYTKAAKVKSTATKYANDSILGIRIFFPTEPVNANAEILPPFEIPGYSDKKTVGSDGTITVAAADAGKGTQFEGGYGVVKNVGVIKTITVNVFGLNFPEGLSVLFKDQNGNPQEYFLGYTNFDGWKAMTWSNPNYITDVRNRDLHSFPLYPNSAPLVSLIGFKVYKNASMDGGDFVGYIRDVSIVYDKALLTLDRDISDEDTWGILQAREADRRNAELQRLGQLQVQRYLEKQKMDQGPSASTSASPAASK